ncbi:MAG TPA: hypothetical protein VNG93_12915 [Candidatus Dormibacteraeota bacterium]|nr:hypothetical protein [Candidatus Dormibacteraeota bacterium]
MEGHIGADRVSAGSGSVLAWAGVLAAGIALVLVAQFLLDGFADSSTMGHWIQHASLFLAGGLVGGALVRLYQLGSRAA